MFGEAGEGDIVSIVIEFFFFAILFSLYLNMHRIVITPLKIIYIYI